MNFGWLDVIRWESKMAMQVSSWSDLSGFVIEISFMGSYRLRVEEDRSSLLDPLS